MVAEALAIGPLGRLLCAWMLAVVSVQGATAAPGSSPVPFSADPARLAAWPAQGEVAFDVLYGELAVRLGTATHRWSHDGQAYRMESVAVAAGLLSVIKSLSYTQRSRGELGSAGLRPQAFEVERGGRRREWSEFDWRAGEVGLFRDGKKRGAALAPGDQDVLTLWHQIGIAAPWQGSVELTVVTGKSAALSRVHALGEESIEVPAGRFRSTHVRAEALDGSLILDVWLAEDHHRLPVRIRMRDRKGETLDQQASSFTFNPTPPRATGKDPR